jgi:uncharacterized sulfatase
VCSPTRASILSGQYPAHVGVIDFIPGHWRPFEKLRVPTNRTQYLPDEITTVAEALRDRGYATALFGKWHLGGEGHGPARNGFDRVTRPAPPPKTPPRHPKPKTTEEWIKAVWDDEEDPKSVDWITHQSEEFMVENREHPFFLFVSHHTVHIPLSATAETVDKYRKKERPAGWDGHPVYAAMVEELDRSVGRILDKLEELDLERDTVVMFYSDNGGLRRDYLGVGPVVSSNAPLRDEKGTLYEGGIRVPLIVRCPGRAPHGQTCTVPVSSVDLFPTFLSLAGDPTPPSQSLDGRDLVPVLRGRRTELRDRPLFWHYPVYHHSTPAGAVRQGDWKLIEFFEDGHCELYNLARDPGETRDLAEDHPQKVAELRRLLTRWRADVGAELPTVNPSFDPERRHEWGRHPDA